MDCSDSPRRSATKSRHIPAEITEEILLKLPVKSLLRFSSVSRSWNLMINNARFSKKYRGRENMIMSNPYCGGGSFKSCPLSTIVSNNPIEEVATDLAIAKFDQIAGALTIRAVYEGLCCLEHEISLSLLIWNPSIQKFHQLPSSPFPTTHQGSLIGPCDFRYHYGLGYDAVGHDYKLLVICYYNHEAALYSLKSDSWRKIQSFPKLYMPSPRPSWFVSGALHWQCSRKMISGEYAIVSFDLSTEEYGEVALPMHYEFPNLVEVVVLRGKLCLSLNYAMERRFVLWVMEDYGVAESWTKKFDIGYDVFGSQYVHPWLRLLCTCDDDDDGQEAICVTGSYEESWVVLKNKDGHTLARKNFRKGAFYWKYGFVYVESLVSSPAFVTSQENKDRNI